MEREGQPSESDPDLEHEVDHEPLDEELVHSSVQEMEQPLLRGVGSVMPDVPSGEPLLLVEIRLPVPCPELLLGHSQTLTVHQTHVLSIAEFVMSQSTSYRTSIVKNDIA